MWSEFLVKWLFCHRDMASKVDAYVLKQSQAVYVHRNIEARSRNHCYSEKQQVLHILSVCL
jgi:hypothetical protein